jgi:OmpA-OmpF porin, OOP family
MKLALNIIVLGLALSLTACKKAPEKAAAPAAPAVPATAPTPAPAPAPAAAAPAPAAPVAAAPAGVLASANFDWNTVPESTSDIGVYPYFKAPDLLVVQGSGGGGVSKTGYSEEADLGKLITMSDSGIHELEGRLTMMTFKMAESGKSFNQYLFDKSMDSYILSIGAKLIYKGILSSEQREAFKKVDPNAARFMVENVFDNDPVRFYAFKQKEKKLMIQVSSNSAVSYMKFVELKEFKQSIQKYSSEGMKKEIDATGKAIVNINFDTDKATLKADGQEVVNQIVALLKGAPALKLSIEGHTDNTGSAKRNKVLSAERSNAVMLALVNTGIGKDNLKAAGFGADKPLVANDSEENKAKNRRVELVKF